MRPRGGVAFQWRRSRRVRLLVRRAGRVRLSVRRQAQNAPFRHVAAPGRCGATPPPGCGALWRMPQLGRCARATPRQAAGRLARGSADLGLESGPTERRTLQPPSHGKAHSAIAPHGKAQCAWLPAHRVRFLVRRAYRVRFSVGRRRVCAGEEKRTLRKDAFWLHALT